MRTLLVGQLVDVAPVNVPAYVDTTAGLRSLAERFSADLEEVRSLAAGDQLRKFFTRTDDAGPKQPRKRMFGPAAAATLLGRAQDPWA
jgi:hypothetical protein